MAHGRASADWLRNLSGARHAAGGRLDRGEAAEMRGDANAATGVGAETHRRAAGRDDGGFAAAAAARGAGEVVRIVGASVDEVVALDGARKLRHVGLAEEDGAGRAQSRNRRS